VNSNTAHKLTSSEKCQLISLVVQAYNRNPEKLVEIIPELRLLLTNEKPISYFTVRSFGITERERDEQINLLNELIHKYERGELDPDGANHALEKCAILIDNQSLPLKVDHKILLKLVSLVIGNSPNSLDKNSEKIVSNELQSRKLFIIRGVKLSLTWDYRLVSINIYPHMMKERSKFLSFIGKRKVMAGE
jgi:hypothetical protein